MESLTTWAKANRQSVAVLNKARRLRIRCAPFSGFHALVHGLRATADLDLFTHPEYFDRMRKLLPEGQTVRKKAVSMRDGSGVEICFETDEFTTVMDGVDVQMVRPLTDVFVDGVGHDVSFTDLTAAHLQPHRVPGGIINMVPQADSAIAKTVFQRDGSTGKHDRSDVMGLAPYARRMLGYLAERALEAGFTDREYAYLGAAGIDLTAPPARGGMSLPLAA